MSGIPTSVTESINKKFHKEAFIYGFCMFDNVKQEGPIKPEHFNLICHKGNFEKPGNPDADKGWFFVRLDDIWDMRWDDSQKQFVPGNVDTMPNAKDQTDFQLLKNFLRWKVTHREQGETGGFYSTSVLPIMYGNTSGLNIPAQHKASNWKSTEARLAKYGQIKTTAKGDLSYIGWKTILQRFTATPQEEHKIKQVAIVNKKQSSEGAAGTKRDTTVRRKSSATPAKVTGSGLSKSKRSS